MKRKMNGCQFEKKKFTICPNQSKKYDKNYDKIDWQTEKTKKG